VLLWLGDRDDNPCHELRHDGFHTSAIGSTGLHHQPGQRVDVDLGQKRVDSDFPLERALAFLDLGHFMRDV
jgi:hypothetical protein